MYLIWNLILQLSHIYLEHKFFQENETWHLSSYLERKTRSEAYKNILINIKYNYNTYLNLQIQRGKSHQPQCACTSEGSSQYCLQQRMNQMQHLSYKALFSLENSGKDKRIISKKQNKTKKKNNFKQVLRIFSLDIHFNMALKWALINVQSLEGS